MKDDLMKVPAHRGDLIKVLRSLERKGLVESAIVDGEVCWRAIKGKPRPSPVRYPVVQKE